MAPRHLTRAALAAVLLALAACTTTPRGGDVTLPAPPPVRY